MNLNYLKKRHGVTLIELTVVILLIGVVGLVAFSFISFGNKVLGESTKEYDFQFSTRSVLSLTSQTIRYATAVFTVPQSKFDPDNLAEGWDYIGMVETQIEPGVTGHSIVKFTYDEDTGDHSSIVIVPAQEGVDFQFVFKKVNPDEVDSMLSFTVYSIKDGEIDEFGNPALDLTITSEVNSLNSLQVKDWGTTADPAIAVAFLTAERGQSVVGHVAMVLDTSGSMAETLSGSNPGYGNNSRMEILQEEATTLVNSFSQENNIFISLVPFATSANNPGSFYNAKTNLTTLENEIDNLVDPYVGPIGGTNTGDGLRRAYWNLQHYESEAGYGTIVRNYVIVLVDGVTTFGSAISNNNRNFYMGDQNVDEGYLDRQPLDSSGQIVGNGSTLDSKGTAYVNAIGNLIDDENMRVYVIGFSSIPSELDSVSDIAAACGASEDNVFRAGSQGALTEVFEAIQADIINDLASVIGPF